MATSEGTTRQHLHIDDCPHTLAVLAVLFARRPERAAEIGYEATEHGAWVDWDQLEHSWLSSTEKAAVVTARGIAMAERQGGGWPPEIRKVLVDAVSQAGLPRRRPGE